MLKIYKIKSQMPRDYSKSFYFEKPIHKSLGTDSLPVDVPASEQKDWKSKFHTENWTNHWCW